MLQQIGKKGFSDRVIEQRKCKHTFFNQINQIVNWEVIGNKLSSLYPKGIQEAGRKAYPLILLFKMSLLQKWYGLSDYEVEEAVNDSITFSKFCGLSLEDSLPDHSVVSRFRSHLTKGGGYEILFNLVNEQLESKGVLVKKGPPLYWMKMELWKDGKDVVE